MNETVKTINYYSFLIWDFVILGFMYFVPTLSHLTALPLYQFEPMRCVLLLNLFIVWNKRNAYVMAITLPLFSYIVGNHPVMVKSLIMAVELTINIFLFDIMSKRISYQAGSMFLSIIASKLFYYGLKSICISFGLLSTAIVDTNIYIQLIVTIIISALFAKFTERKL